jgi:hypothetical protein
MGIELFLDLSLYGFKMPCLGSIVIVYGFGSGTGMDRSKGAAAIVARKVLRSTEKSNTEFCG